MKSHDTKESLIIAMLCIENIGRKRDLVTILPILERVKCGYGSPTVMMMEGMEEEQ